MDISVSTGVIMSSSSTPYNFIYKIINAKNFIQN